MIYCQPEVARQYVDPTNSPISPQDEQNDISARTEYFNYDNMSPITSSLDIQDDECVRIVISYGPLGRESENFMQKFIHRGLPIDPGISVKKFMNTGPCKSKHLPLYFVYRLFLKYDPL